MDDWISPKNRRLEISGDVSGALRRRRRALIDPKLLCCVALWVAGAVYETWNAEPHSHRKKPTACSRGVPSMQLSTRRTRCREQIRSDDLEIVVRGVGEVALAASEDFIVSRSRKPRSLTSSCYRGHGCDKQQSEGAGDGIRHLQSD